MQIIRKLTLKSVGVLILALAMVACGGGGDGAPVEVQQNSDSIQFNQGGNPSVPAIISLTVPNGINADKLNNYFKVSVTAGDTLIIKSTLKNTIDDRSAWLCRNNVAGSFKGIILDALSKSCSLNLTHIFTESGEHILSFDYGNVNNGFFDAAIIHKEQYPAPFKTASGRPEQPKVIDLQDNNKLSSNDFYNNYAYDAKAGQTIYIQAYLDKAISEIDAHRCRNNNQNYSNSYFAYGISLSLNLSDQSKYSCGDYFEHRFESDGRYYFNFRYLNGVNGYFRVVITQPIG